MSTSAWFTLTHMEAFTLIDTGLATSAAQISAIAAMGRLPDRRHALPRRPHGLAAELAERSGAWCSTR
jgi:hypothetical protein